MSEQNGLPDGWVATTLEDVLPIHYGKGLTEKNRDPNGKHPVYGSSGAVGVHSEALTSTETLVIGRKGSVGSVHYSPLSCWPIDTTYYAEANDNVSLRFFYHLLTHIRLGQLDKSTTIPSLSRDDYNPVSIQLPPLAEQRRIVAAIEEQFSRLDAGVAALERARANLKRYRTAVLKAAVEGRLTEDWREENPDVEPASELLKRILRERRERWEEEQLAAYEKGKKLPKNWQSKYREPAGPDANDLPNLPERWCWASLPQIGWFDRGRSRHRPRNAPHLYGGPHPFVQTGDVRHAETFIRDYKQTYSEAGLQQSKLWPAGTLCITIAANIAETGILPFDACFPDSVVGFLASPKHVSTRFVEIYLRTIRSRLEAYAPATAQKNINIETLKQVAVALPPLAEQEQIVAEVERRLSILQEVETEVNANLKRAARLRQAILKRAFQGKLVPQDPTDEPASELLERIRAERKRVTAEKRRRNERPARDEPAEAQAGLF